MISSRQAKTIGVIIIFLGLLLLLGSLPTGTQAQGQDKPTPTNEGEGGNDNGGGGSRGGVNHDGTPVPPKAGVWGYVYDYSNAMHQAGVTVVISGGGWQAEAVTDSNGYYQISDLGRGAGVVNLRLPPGTQPVVFDWPVQLLGGVSQQVNLGYYWGDAPPIPVRLTATAAENRLTVTLDNQTGQAATGGLVEIRTPAEVKVLPAVQSSQGAVASFDSHQFRFAPGEIAGGSQVTAEFLLDGLTGVVQVIFTYDQQLTPQMAAIDLSGPDVAPQAALSPAETGAEVAASPAPVAPPTPLPAAETSAEFSPPDTTQPTGLAPLPQTGLNADAAGLGKIWLGAVVLAGLVMGGWWSLKKRG